MAPDAVYLHIGSPKTGTTYIQDVLWANRQALKADGILLPGSYRYARVQAVRDLLKWEPIDGDLPQTWRKLAGEARRWSGRSAIISQEFLCWASTDQITAAVESFPKSRVEVILTTRDLARLVPAQWQTAMRQRNTRTLDEYADAVAGVAEGGQAKAGARRFWRRQDYGPILARWIDAVGLERVRVVTLPPSGGDPTELWSRFCRACGIDTETTAPGGVSHESLGAVSAELMRRLNAHPTIEDMPMRTYQKSVNGALSRRVLGQRRSQEPGLALPEQHIPWAEREAARVIGDIEALGVEVIGDLDDLRPRPAKNPSVAPEELPVEELLAAALDGLAGMTAEHAELMKKIKKAENQSRPRTKQVAAPVKRSFLSRMRGVLARLRAAVRRRRARR
ncbi:MAG: hypothetical protein LH630_10040 [Actinomycetia bacterium]|nr:hypothetical protein [Actinomycetes bacterium]